MFEEKLNRSQRRKLKNKDTRGSDHPFEDLKRLNPSQDKIFDQVRTGTIRDIAKKYGLNPSKRQYRQMLLSALPEPALAELMDIARSSKGAKRGACYYSLTLKRFHQIKRKL
jgi:hypothetical protein